LSRVAALAILLVLGGVIWAGVVSPLFDRFSEYRETIETADNQLPQLLRLAAMTPALQARLDQAQSNPLEHGKLLSGASDALAAAELQNQLKYATVRNGVKLRSTQILAPHDEDAFRRIGIRVAFEADVAALQKVFYDLEGSSILLILDNVRIRSRKGGRAVRTARTKATYQANNLSVRVDIFGYSGGTAQ
jgi:hypothetical protein